MLKFRFVPGLLFLALASVLWGANQRITILHLNDTHGQIEPVKARNGSTYGGLARVAYLVDSLDKSADASGTTLYFLHAGDAAQGTPLSNVSEGKFDMKLFNEMGLDALCLGNHEFDFGQANLDSLMTVADFPMLSANIVDSSGARPFQAFIQQKIGRQRVLIVGMTTEYAGISTSPDNVIGLAFLPADSVLTALLDSLRYGDKDLVIVLEHRGWAEDSALALAEPRIDVIVGGHSHTVIENPEKVSNALIVQAGAKGVYLGKLDLEVSKGKVVAWNGGLLLVSDSTPSQPKMAAEIAEASARLDEKLGGVIGKTEKALVAGLVAGPDEISTGNLLAQLMLEETRSDVAFTNQGGVRAHIVKGDVSMKDILTALPFPNTVVTMELTGAELRAVLDYNILLGTQSGGTLHLAGVSCTPKDGKALDIKVGGAALDDSKLYKIATNDYLAAGGDGYAILKSARNIYDTGTLANDLLVRYIKKVGVIK